MTGQTTAGLPYPEPTDLLWQTDQYINDLAAAITVATSKNPGQVPATFSGTSDGNGNFTLSFAGQLSTVAGCVAVVQGAQQVVVLSIAGSVVSCHLENYLGAGGGPTVAANTQYVARAVAWGVV